MQDNPVLNFLAERRSVLARNMSEPGPDRDTLKTLLSIAMRVPDHGKLTPWRLVIVQNDDRKELGEIAARELAAANAGPEEVETETVEAARGQFLRAPCVVAVLACPRTHPKIPRSEQLYSAGAVCMMLVTAARAAGFAAQWLTGAAAYNDDVRARLGGGAEDEIAGFIYLGSCDEKPTERARPNFADIACFGLPDTSST
ncbi:MAG: nitroreductase family protein [Parvibaculales bacterium]